MCGSVRASVKSLHEAEILSIPVAVEVPECSRCQDHGTSVKEEPYVECSLCKREREILGVIHNQASQTLWRTEDSIMSP